MLQRPMTLLDFQSKFSTDDVCRNQLFSTRWSSLSRDHVKDDATIVHDGFGAYQARAAARPDARDEVRLSEHPRSYEVAAQSDLEREGVPARDVPRH